MHGDTDRRTEELRCEKRDRKRRRGKGLGIREKRGEMMAENERENSRAFSTSERQTAMISYVEEQL